MTNTTIPTATPIYDALRARTTDPATSHEAAARASVRASQQYVLRILRDYGACADFHISNIARKHRVTWSETRLRTARAELVRKGYVVDTGNTLPTPSGRRSTICSITVAGLDAMEAAA